MKSVAMKGNARNACSQLFPIACNFVTGCGVLTIFTQENLHRSTGNPVRQCQIETPLNPVSGNSSAY